jgi:hypothetical protein
LEAACTGEVGADEDDEEEKADDDLLAEVVEADGSDGAAEETWRRDGRFVC